ncbi:unnamed protein product [Cylindrotheca closterium]|uniref:ATP-dependent RNA helicase n=1 Tax=Cylindrotheca closterium TaxID=2856 RepID=A0AAD2CP81_9STRA|nr:unnamed protein product [Cylindrotheca closterium]
MDRQRLLLLSLLLSTSSAFLSKSRTSPRNIGYPLFLSDDLSFADLGLSPEVLSCVASQSDWRTPTEPQILAIPKLLEVGTSSEHVIMVEAPTGSGKTATYALPLLESFQRGSQDGRIAALILCPTRELAAQIGSVIKNLANNVASKKQMRKTVMVLHGGIPLQPQIQSLADCARNEETIDFLVATPGRLVDVLTYYQKGAGDSSARDAAFERRVLDALDQQGKQDVTLSKDQLEMLGLNDFQEDDGRAALVNLLSDLKLLVLDEADRLLSRQFEPEFRAVLDLLPKSIPMWMFSATFPKFLEPRMNHIVSEIGAKHVLKIKCSNVDRLPHEQEVSSSLKRKLERSSTSAETETMQKTGSASTISLRAIRLDKKDRTQALLSLLEDHPEWDRVLVFVATRYASEHVSRKLRRGGLFSSELHGKLDQQARERRLNDLKKGKIRVLLATDVASRGLDVSGLPVIFNYDLPRSTADFVHRVGRTGRAGKTGTAVSFVTASSEEHMELIEKRHLNQHIERETLPRFQPDEEKWMVEVEGSRTGLPGVQHSEKGLAHDRMFGGIKGRRKSKKDKLREAAATKESKETKKGT